MNSVAIPMRGTGARSAVMTVLGAGTLAATGDLLFAFVYYGFKGVQPVRILQTIGSGILGTAAFDGGWSAAALGFVCHFFILIVAGWFYLLAGKRLPLLTRQPFAAGVAYGVIIYLVMNFIVVPLSNAPHFNRSLINTAAELGSHVLLVGLSIAYVVRRLLRA
jgi:uncharacterized membrane protein YagU involved in acid resistance